MIKITNLRDELKAKVETQEKMVVTVRDAALKSSKQQAENIESMREQLIVELKNLKKANELFAQELERNQILFRSLQNELLMTMDEKKAQNESILNSFTNDSSARGGGAHGPGSKRSLSVDMTKTQQSVASLLPNIKFAADSSNTKLTQRQFKVAALVRQERLGLGENLFDPSRNNLMPDGSVATLNQGLASNQNFKPQQGLTTPKGGKRMNQTLLQSPSVNFMNQSSASEM